MSTHLFRHPPFLTVLIGYSLLYLAGCTTTQWNEFWYGSPAQRAQYAAQQAEMQRLGSVEEICYGLTWQCQQGKGIILGKRYTNYAVEVISDPPGAIIEFENEYRGTAPFTLRISGDLGAQASGWEITATPRDGIGCRQRKNLSGGSVIPRTLYFNTKVCG